MAASLIGRLSGTLCRLGSSFVRPAVSNATSPLLQTAGHCQSHARSLMTPVSGHYQSHARSLMTPVSGHYQSHARSLMTPVSTAGIPTVPTCRPPGSLLKACQPFMNSVRTKIRYSIRRGKPKPVKAVIYRFYRLHSGIYIRPRAGRHKHRWRKPEWILDQAKYHVFCNKQQSRLLDRMTTRFWKKKRYYPDDPYAPYQKGTNMPGIPEVPKFLP